MAFPDPLERRLLTISSSLDVYRKIYREEKKNANHLGYTDKITKRSAF